MHAIQLHEFGPADNLRYEELPDIHAASGQVRIAVAAAGVHVLDTALRSGSARGPMALPPLPTIPGREVAGTIDEVGDGVDDGWIGQRVVVHLGMVPGGYASQAVAAAEALHAVPEGLDDKGAVAMVGTGRTTMAIAELAAFGPTDVVLITAAAGGIGSLLVQIAKQAGAAVVGLASGSTKTQQALWSGADFAVDYAEAGWPARVRRQLDGRSPTVAIDGVGGVAGRSALELLGVGGRFVMIGWMPGNEPTQVTTSDLYGRGLTASAAVGPRILQRPGGMRSLESQALDLASSGTVTPVVQAFPLADAAAAHQAIETRATTGKVVLVP